MNLDAPIFSEKEILEKDLKNGIERLFKLAENTCWNILSKNCMFILSEIKYPDTRSFEILRFERKKTNETKKLATFEQISFNLTAIYADLYDINLYVYKSTHKLTIIEIQYLRKSAFDKNYWATIKDNPSMVHAKIGIPPYIDFENRSKKFDINWELGGFEYTCKMFWWRFQWNIKRVLTNKSQNK